MSAPKPWILGAAAPVLALVLAGSTPAARTLDLPLYDPARGLDAVPAYAADVVELALAPQAAGGLRPAAADPLRLRHPALDGLAAELGATLRPEFPGEMPPVPGSRLPDLTRYVVVQLAPGVDLADALDRFAALPGVEAALPIPVLPVSRVPNDSLFASSYWYQEGADHDTDATEAWDVTVGDPSIVLAIVDTGVLPWHPDIGGTQAGSFGNLWLNPAEANGVPGVDDDDRGVMVDDLYGWDFVSGVTGVATCEDSLVADNDPSDFDGHGTMVAGLAGALTDNLRGTAGMAWRCRLMVLRIGWRDAGGNGRVRMDFCADAIRYAARKGAHVINCSWQSANTNGIDAALTLANRLGVSVVNASGNNGSPNTYLMDRGDCVDVSATDEDDRVPRPSGPWGWWANVGPGVDLCAPGHLITSTFTLGQATPNCSNSRTPSYDTNRGTSFSAPLVTGAVGLIQSLRRQQGKRLLPPETIRLRLRETADDITAQNPLLAGQLGGGRLNAYRALTDPPTSWGQRVAGRQLGGSVVLPTLSGTQRLALLTSNRRLLVLGGAEGDTVVDVALPATPSSHLAAATLSAGGPIGLFFGGSNGTAHGYRPDGTPLPGWPRSSGAGLPLLGGPALADLDLDQSPEVIFLSADGGLHAWHSDGTVVSGFPVAAGVGFTNHPAVGDLEGDGALEIVAAATDGTLSAWRADGTIKSGWPVTLPGSSPGSPVLARLTPGGLLTVVVGDASHMVSAFSSDPQPLPGWPVGLGAPVVLDPAAGDVVGDGLDEIAVTAANVVHLLRADGTRITLAGSRQGSAEPILADLTGDGRPEIVVDLSGSLYAHDSTGTTLAGWPRRCGVRVGATVADLDADGRAEVAAGTAVSTVLLSDTTLYCHDAGPASFSAGGLAWPTARGSAARTGAAGAPTLPAADDIAPDPLADLDALAVTDSSVTLVWTAVADVGATGRGASYDLRYATSPITEGSFASATPVPGVPVPGIPGDPEAFTVEGLASATRYHFAVKVVDAAGNRSALSNPAQAATTGGGPLRGTTGPALRAAPHPAKGTALLYYRAEVQTPGFTSRLSIHDVRGRLVREVDLGSRAEDVFLWNGEDEAGSLVPAGIYFVRFTTGRAEIRSRLVWIP